MRPEGENAPKVSRSKPQSTTVRDGLGRPGIPEARVELDRIGLGAAVIEVGWGCEVTTNLPPGTRVELDRFKLDESATIVATEIQRHEPRISDEQRARIDASYLITAGRDQNSDDASLCLGDSGGPLYLG